MQFVYFHDSSNLWPWINDNYSKALYIAPSPSKADGLRTNLQNRGISTDVLTINKFLSDLIKEKKLELNLKRKSELYLIFGWLRPAYFPELTFEQFSNAYTLFSELRSFTLDLLALNTLLEQQDQQVRKAIELFWSILETTGFHDEHSAYAELTQSLRGEHLVENRNHFIFWGFQHLNGQQVDFLKALAIRDDVIIPFPMSLKNSLKSSDWPSWLTDGLNEGICIDQKVEAHLKLKWRKTNSRELSFQLKQTIKNNDQVVLGVNNIEESHLHLLPFGGTHFKIPHQLVKNEITTYFNGLKEMGFAEFESKLVRDLKAAVEEQNFKMIKVIQLIQEALNSMDDITDSKPYVDNFFIYLLKEVVSLNQPRTSFTSLSSGEERVDLKAFNDLSSLDTSRRVLFCLDDRFGELISLGQRYSLEMMSHLSVLGPLKRSELDLEYKKWELKEIVKQNNSLLLMQEDLLKHSLSWSKILEGIEVESEDSRIERSERKIEDFYSSKEFIPFEGSFSASKVRSYLECPRKFYFNYIEKTFPDVVLTTELDPRVKGTLSHKIIEVAVKDKVEDISSLARTILDEEVKDLKLKDEEYQTNLIQLTLRSSNGLSALKRIETVLGVNPEWKMEERFTFECGDQFRGQIDCYAIVGDYLILLDFKSTTSATPTLSKIRTIDDIQLWTYLMGLENKGIDIKGKSLIVGYIVLDEPAKSVLLFSDDNLSKDFKDFFSANPFKVELDETLEAVKDKLQEVVTLIKNDKTFAAIPSNANVCMFCDLNRICMKGSTI